MTKEQKQKLAKWENRALELMAKFNLTQGMFPWKFSWIDRKSTYGWCSYRTRTISLSKTYVLHAVEEGDVEDTIRHEIGHALLPPGAGHGPKWKALARNVGYNPKRCSSTKLATDQYKYIGFCPKGHVSHRHRKAKSVTSCIKCCPKFNRDFLIKYMTIEEAKDKGLIKSE